LSRKKLIKLREILPTKKVKQAKKFTWLPGCLKIIGIWWSQKLQM